MRVRAPIVPFIFLSYVSRTGATASSKSFFSQEIAVHAEFPTDPEFMVALAGFPEHPVILLPRREHCFESPKAAQKGDSHENVR